MDNLKKLVIYNADLITGVEGSANALYGDLDWLKRYVKKYIEEYGHNDFLNDLSKNVRKLVY